MTTGAFKDLVIDAVDAQTIARFWARAVGLTATTVGDGPGAVLTGSRPEHTIWINQVPEPVTTKQRTHLDLRVASAADLVALGARVEAERPDRTVLRDPEGGELCAVAERPPRPADHGLPDHRLHALVVDSRDPGPIAAWWADRFGLGPPPDDGGRSGIRLEGGSLPYPLVFVAVPEPKTVKNRIHWDVVGSTGQFLAAGARLLRRRDDEIGWDVLADPDGNEFCVFTAD